MECNFFVKMENNTNNIIKSNNIVKTLSHVEHRAQNAFNQPTFLRSLVRSKLDYEQSIII